MRDILLRVSFLLPLLLSGCAGGGSGPSDPSPDPGTPPVERVVSLEISPLSTTVRTGEIVVLTATPMSATGARIDGMAVEWGSEDANLAFTPVANEPDRAEVTSAVETAARVTATVQTSDGPVSGHATVQFHTVHVATVHVLPTTTTLPVGRTMRFTATPRDERGVHERLAVVTWSTSNPDVTVTPYARDPHQADVRSFVEAEAIVSASVDDVSGNGTIRFYSLASCPPIDHVQIAITDGLIDVGQETHLQAIPKDAAGNSLPTAGCQIAWASTPGLTLAVDPGNPAVATGTGASPGTATVTVTVGGTAGSVDIIVRAAGG